MEKFINEFKSFAIKGNAFDLAVGVIVGGAFGKIVTSIVEDIIMPLIGIILGGNNLAKLKFTVTLPGKAPVVLAYGNFLQNVLNFLIISFCIFLFVKFFNNFKKKEEAKPATITELSMLTEIRDLLKKSK